MFESEEIRIVERIKDFIKNTEPHKKIYDSSYVILRNGHILRIDDYYDMVSHGKINPNDAYVDFKVKQNPVKSAFYYPILAWEDEILNAYLSKLTFYDRPLIAPATGLKYVAYVVGYEKYVSEKYLSIELLNLDTAVNNTNLRKIVVEVLGDKLVSGGKELTYEEYNKIDNMFRSQRLFAGHNFQEAWDIIDDYYLKDNRSLIKEVARITMDYERIFQPYRVCYDMNNWNEIDCWSIKLY